MRGTHGRSNHGGSDVTFWAVVTTHPQAENRALAHLERQAFNCYAPLERVTEIRRHRRVEVIRFLFPRYLFIWIDSQWHAIRGTFGVSMLIMNGEKPSRVPAGWVEKMIASEVDGAIELPQPCWVKGDRVTIEGGLFDGCSGLYRGMSSRQREVVLLEKLGRVELASGCRLR